MKWLNKNISLKIETSEFSKKSVEIEYQSHLFLDAMKSRYLLRNVWSSEFVKRLLMCQKCTKISIFYLFFLLSSWTVIVNICLNWTHGFFFLTIRSDVCPRLAVKEYRNEFVRWFFYIGTEKKKLNIRGILGHFPNFKLEQFVKGKIFFVFLRQVIKWIVPVSRKHRYFSDICATL